VIVAAVLLPGAAQAHLMTTGLGPIYDGVSHVVMTPEDWVSVLALALFAGLCGPDAGRGVLFILPLAWVAGSLFGMLGVTLPGLPIPAIFFLLLGALVAANLRVPLRVAGALAVVVGGALGLLNGAAMPATSASALELVGMAVTIFVLVALAAALVVSRKSDWERIVVRVAGSWIAAAGLLMIGWAIRKHGG